jgi:hypothetical protein
MENDFIKNATFGLKGLIDMGDKGSFFPGGHNGPYMNLETPVRNTAHWIINFTIAYQLSKTTDFKLAALKCVDWLINCPYYENAQYLQRQGSTDTCNGVIGDAWVLESLAFAKKWLPEVNISKLIGVQTEVMNRMRISKNFAFKRYDTSQGYLTCDYTFNHQLWLLMSLIDSKPDGGEHKLILDYYLNNALRVRKNGLIHHLYHSFAFKNIVNRVSYKKTSFFKPNMVNLKERGYHLFNIFALARINISMSGMDELGSKKISQALSLIDEDFLVRMYEEDNKYSFNYNSPGFELPLILEVFGHENKNKLITLAYKLHKEKTWNDQRGAYIENCDDPLTMSARSYELGLYLMFRKFGRV